MTPSTRRQSSSRSVDRSKASDRQRRSLSRLSKSTTNQKQEEKPKKTIKNERKKKDEIIINESLNKSQLNEIEENITTSSIFFSDASILNSKEDEQLDVDVITQVDERCFEVLRNSELDEMSDQSEDEIIQPDHQLNLINNQFSSPFQSPKRLSSVSPIETSVRITKGTRRLTRKNLDSPSDRAEGALKLDSRSIKETHVNEGIITEEETKNNQENQFESKIVLPFLHELLSHLSGNKPLSIQIPKKFSKNNINSDENYKQIQSIIDLTPCLVGLEDLEIELRSLLFRSISQHEGNVLLLSGPRGSGKTALVSRSLSLFSDEKTFGPKGFHTIKLNGLVHNNDKIALKEMCRQLFSSLSSSNDFDSSIDNQKRRKKLENFNEDLDFDPDLDQDELEDERNTENLYYQPKFTNYGETLKNLLDVLEPNGSTGEDDNLNDNRKALVIILEDFDMFSDLDRQSFLYCLLDSVQGNKRKNGICVIGTTSVVDCLDRLEKRVKSRCQSRIRYLDSPTTDSERIELIKSLLELSDFSIISDISSSRSNKKQIQNQFINKWNEELDIFLTHAQVLDWLKSKYQLINEPLIQILQDLNAMISKIAYDVRRTEKMKLPILKPSELFQSTSNNGMGRKSTTERRLVRSSTAIFSSLPWWTNEISILEFSVLVACKHLSSIHHNGIFNLEMAWDLYRQHLQRHAHDTDMDPLHNQRDHHLRVANVRSQIYGRDAFELAWERLKRLEIIIPLKILNSRIYTSLITNNITTNKNKKNLTESIGIGRGYELVKFTPFLTQIDLVISQLSNHLLANHLLKWVKNSTD